MKDRGFLLFFISVFAVCVLPAQSPTFNFQKLGSEEGLNSNSIFNIEQGPNGLIYITTQNGIYFYDGSVFYKVKTDSVKSNELITASVMNPDELYLSVNNKGLARFNLRTKEYKLIPQLKIGDNGADKFILKDDFAYLLSTQINLSVYNIKSGEKLFSDRGSKNRTNLPNCIFKTAAGKILVGRSDGLYEVNGSRQVRMEVLKNTPVYSIAEMKNGNLIVGVNNKIIFLKDNAITREFTPKIKAATYSLGGDKSIDKIVADDFGRIWFTVFPGGNLYLLENENVYDVFGLLGLPQEFAQCLFKDKDQNIWVGTLDDGVYYIQNPFLNSLAYFNNGKSLAINQILLKDDLLAAATSNGLYALNLTDHQTTAISKPSNDDNGAITSVVEQAGNFYYSKVFEGAPFNLTAGKSKYIFKSVESTKLLPYKSDELILTDRFSRDIYLYANGKIKDTLISFPDYKIQVYDLLVHKEILYAATNSGLYLYDFKEKKYKASGNKDLGMKLNGLAEIEGEIYAAHESGITRVSDGKLISQLGNLRLNSVKKLVVYQDKIWIATLDGIFICDKNFSPLKVMNKSFGLSSNQVNDLVFSGDLVGIATARGLVISKVKDLLTFNSALPPVSIDHIQVNGKDIDFSNSSISLKADEDNLNIRFFSPFFNFFNGQKKQLYRYRFDNDEWINITDNSFGYSISKGGKHRFEISASVDQINWSQPTVINISKEEKLTESSLLYWLITFGGLLLIAGVSFAVIRRVQARAVKRLEEERQVNLLKHQAMNSLLSPHFIFNSLTSIQNYINSNNSLKASEYLAKFSRLIRMIIEKAAQGDITLQDELTRLSYYLELEKERFKNKFDFYIQVDDALNRTEIRIPNMIIQPHAENCIIHGILPKLEHGTLNINFSKTPQNKLLIKIEDDGIGLIKAKEHAKTGHKSLGTATIKNILEINSKLTGKKQNVSMVDKSTLNPPAQGTLITIELEL